MADGVPEVLAGIVARAKRLIGKDDYGFEWIFSGWMCKIAP
jgi:hypothetical protein